VQSLSRNMVIVVEIITDELSTIKRLHHRLQQSEKNTEIKQRGEGTRRGGEIRW
jgi:hypothetical protein